MVIIETGFVTYFSFLETPLTIMTYETIHPCPFCQNELFEKSWDDYFLSRYTPEELARFKGDPSFLATLGWTRMNVGLCAFAWLIVAVGSAIQVYCDEATDYQLSIQDASACPIEWALNFYDLLVIIVIIFYLIIILLLNLIRYKYSNSNSNFSHSQNLKIFWAIDLPDFFMQLNDTLGQVFAFYNIIYNRIICALFFLYFYDSEF